MRHYRQPLVAAIIVCAFVMLWTQGFMTPARSRAASPCASPTGQVVSITVKNPDGTQLQIPNVPWVENCTVHLAMMNAQQINPHLLVDTSYFCPFGSFATSIDGFQESGDHFWALYVNGTFAQLGMDTQLLRPNDQVVWQVRTMAAVPEHLHASVQAKVARQRLARRIDAVLRQTSSQK